MTTNTVRRPRFSVLFALCNIACALFALHALGESPSAAYILIEPVLPLDSNVVRSEAKTPWGTVKAIEAALWRGTRGKEMDSAPREYIHNTSGSDFFSGRSKYSLNLTLDEFHELALEDNELLKVIDDIMAAMRVTVDGNSFPLFGMNRPSLIKLETGEHVLYLDSTFENFRTGVRKKIVDPTIGDKQRHNPFWRAGQQSISYNADSIGKERRFWIRDNAVKVVSLKIKPTISQTVEFRRTLPKSIQTYPYRPVIGSNSLHPIAYHLSMRLTLTLGIVDMQFDDAMEKYIAEGFDRFQIKQKR